MTTEKRSVEARLRDALHSAAREAPLPRDFAASVAGNLAERPPTRSGIPRFALPAAAVAGVLVVALLASALQRPEGPGPGVGGEWGPLAVVAPSAGQMDALAVGTLHISPDCVVLEEAENQMTMLVWPADRTSWDAATRSITFVTFAGQRVTLADGDTVTFGGGGDSTDESGISGEAWRNGMEWIAPPADGCPLESRWSVGDVVTPTDGEGQAWPTVPEQLPAAVSSAPGARLTCGGEHSFPASALEAPTGAEDESGPEYDALRAAFTFFGAEFPEADQLSWRVVDLDDTGALFLARAADTAPAWLKVEVGDEDGTWKPLGMGQCDPVVVLSSEFGPATWALDPDFPAPDAGTTELHVLVWERACSSGRPTTGRMSAPVVEYAPDTVTITIGVRPVGGDQDCQGPPGTPAIVTLPQPLGDRMLLDGGRHPPAEPSPAF